MFSVKDDKKTGDCYDSNLMKSEVFLVLIIIVMINFII